MTNTNTMYVGTLTMRKARGRKLSFIMGGGFDNVEQMQQTLRAQPNTVYEFHGCEVDAKTGKPTDSEGGVDAPFSILVF